MHCRSTASTAVFEALIITDIGADGLGPVISAILGMAPLMKVHGCFATSGNAESSLAPRNKSVRKVVISE